MLGYITPERPELKIKEFEIYSGYYCGICKSIARRYGQLPRLALSYDSVLLALLIAGISKDADAIKIKRCMVHPMKKRTIVYDSKEIDYAADILLLLAYYKLKDDYVDDKNIKAILGMTLMKRPFNRLMKFRKDKFHIVQDKLEELAHLEEEHCSSIDVAAEPFAKLLEEVFDPSDDLDSEGFKDQGVRQIYRRIGYHLGKWIYLIDAYDDIEENIKKGSYNPLIYQFKYNEDSQETVEVFRERIRDRVELNLMCYLEALGKCCGELKFNKNQGLIENIIYMGLLRKTEQILMKGNNQNAESL